MGDIIDLRTRKPVPAAPDPEQAGIVMIGFDVYNYYRRVDAGGAFEYVVSDAAGTVILPNIPAIFPYQHLASLVHAFRRGQTAALLKVRTDFDQSIRESFLARVKDSATDADGATKDGAAPVATVL